MDENNNTHDISFLAIYALIGFVLLALVVTASNTTVITSAVSIYSAVFTFSMLFVFLSVIFPNYFGFIIFGKEASEQTSQAKLVVSLILCGIIGFLIVTQFLSLFSINFIPSQFKSLVASPANSNGEILFLTLLGPIAETFLFFGILIPTFKKFIKNLGMPAMLLFFALIIIFLTNYSALGIILIILAVIFQFVPSLKRLSIQNKTVITFIAISFASVSFGLYHVRAYSDLASPQTAIFGAIAFGYVSGYLQELLNNNIGPQFMHIVANSTTAVQDTLTSVPYGIFIIGAYVGLLFLIRKFHTRLKVKNLFSAVRIG